MKPRNKKQQHIVELSGRLRPLTTAQKQWAFSHTIDHYAYRLKSGKAVCQHLNVVQTAVKLQILAERPIALPALESHRAGSL